MGWVTDEDGEKRWAVVFSDNDREELGAAEVKSCVARGARLSAVANAAAQEQQLQKHAVAWTQTHDQERARSAARDKTLRNGSRAARVRYTGLDADAEEDDEEAYSLDDEEEEDDEEPDRSDMEAESSVDDSDEDVKVRSKGRDKSAAERAGPAAKGAAGKRGKPTDAVARNIAKEKAKAEELSEYRKSKDIGMHLDEGVRKRLLQMKTSRRRLSSESKNSAPKKEYSVDNPCLIDYCPPPLRPRQQYLEAVDVSSGWQRVEIPAAPAAEGGAQRDGGQGEGAAPAVQKREAAVYQFCKSGHDCAGAAQGRGVVGWMPEVHAKIPREFQIGLVVGRSGAGKSVFLREFFPAPAEVGWGRDEAVISHFDSPEEASQRLMAVGLNAVPTWLKPYRILSNGEKFRATLARQVQSGATIDDFTCITNRNVAASTAVSVVCVCVCVCV